MAPPSVFPDRRTSKRLSWGIPTATVTSRNFSFALGLGVFYWLMTWLFATSPVVPQGGQKLACEQRLASIERELRTSEAKGAIKDSKICERPVVLNGLISGSKPKESLIPGYERPDITLADYTSYIVDAAVNQFALALFGMAVFAMLYRFSGAKHRWSKALQAGMHHDGWRRTVALVGGRRGRRSCAIRPRSASAGPTPRTAG